MALARDIAMEWVMPHAAVIPARLPDVAAGMMRALEEDRLLPYYQPVFDLAAGHMVGFEALARCIDPAHGLIEPADFASAFDDPRLAVAIGQRVLARLCDDLTTWDEARLGIGEIALNVSEQELRQGHFAAGLAARLAAVGLSPARITVEITEAAGHGMRCEAARREVLRLHEMGVTIALDDFGTGFASLVQLRQVPADRMKIDRRFITRLEDDPDDAAIVAGLISLAHRLGMKAVAEGVETPAQLAMLRNEGCDLAQGYLLGRPMPAAAVPHFAAGIGQ